MPRPQPSPAYILDEARLRRNLDLIQGVARESGAEIALALKAFALWRAFPIVREYGFTASASGSYEARLAHEELGVKAHTYSPALAPADLPAVAEHSQSLTFNSLAQARLLLPLLKGKPLSCGLRINPEYSEIATPLYDPCAPGSRFGVVSAELSQGLPEGIEGLHCHNHCESSAEALAATLARIEQRFGHLLPKLKWLNLGGGHLMTRKGYDLPLLVSLIQALRRRHPALHVILEPGSAFAWEAGTLEATVVDIVANHGISTAILNVSFTCHMPDCLEMPYQPAVRGAATLSPTYPEEHPGEPCVYRLGGNSCLSGDWLGAWRFPSPLRPGDPIVFEDMAHYTTVKTTMFNGVPHPALLLRRADGTLSTLRRYTYRDYKSRMS